jgi:hypothetical protein
VRSRERIAVDGILTKLLRHHGRTLGESMAETQTPGGRPLSLGERRVRRSFNPNQANHVAGLKSMAAALIDYAEQLKHDPEFQDNPEALRLFSLAQTHAEDAAMWAVKGCTINLP